MCLLLYACNPETPTEVGKTNTQITDYTVTVFANHRVYIIEYCGHEYMCVGTGGIVHLESCKCHNL